MIGLPRTLSFYFGGVFLVTIVVVFLSCLIAIYLADLSELMRRASDHPEISFTAVAMMAIYKLPGTGQVVLPFSVLIGCLIAFYRLSRRNELTVARAAGVSVWQFIAPGCIAAFLFGVIAVTLYNPLAAYGTGLYARAEAESLGGKEAGMLGNVGTSLWLRQSNQTGTAVINAQRALDRGLELHGVVVYQFDKGDRFLTRISAERAIYDRNRWRLDDAWITGRSGEPVHEDEYWVETALSHTQVAESISSPTAIAFWDLPVFIAIAERAGLSANRYRVHYQMLLAQPVLFSVMVLVAAVFSLRLFRLGQVMRLIVAGLIVGLALFMTNQVSRALGDNGSLPPLVAAWWPIVLAALASAAALFYQEDG